MNLAECTVYFSNKYSRKISACLVGILQEQRSIGIALQKVPNVWNPGLGIVQEVGKHCHMQEIGIMT